VYANKIVVGHVSSADELFDNISAPSAMDNQL
jgi:hypothetical protein